MIRKDKTKTRYALKELDRNKVNIWHILRDFMSVSTTESEE